MTAINILQGLLTPVIALLALYIAYQQWQVNERKYHLDLYERRLRVYREVVAFLSRVFRDFKPDITELQAFIASTAEADFLFDADIPTYRDEIYKRAWAVRWAHSQYHDTFQLPPPPGYDHQKIAQEICEQEKWFAEQVDNQTAKQKFKKYLDVTRRQS